jgi:hypothetical protein
MSGFDSFILIGSVWQHVDCARDSSGEMPAAVVVENIASETKGTTRE